ncbi:porin [Oceanospirillum beijerinckii]|uniref:porin n=1 Tax=Oceanospirillum beijerinckii TaxID=64976 RepID=UPI000409E474|nr:porin [Oceanospirillum beijerinckii]
MKKTLIATAIAGAMSFTAVAQAAEVNYDLYGSLRVVAENPDEGDLNIGDNSSRVGIKASTELNGGITGIARLEFKAKTDSGDVGDGRLAYIGATGGFGTVTAGRQWTPQYLWTSGKVDILDVGSNPTHSYDWAGRQGNTLAYITPDMGGFQAAAVLVARNSGVDTGDDADAYNLAAHYSAGGFSVAVASLMYQGSVDENYTSVAASYTMGDLYVAAEATDNGIDDENTFEVAGSYAMGDVKLLANFVSFEDGEQVAVEAQYKLGAQSRVAATIVTADDDAEAAKAAGKTGSSDSVALSWRVDF